MPGTYPSNRTHRPVAASPVAASPVARRRWSLCGACLLALALTTLTAPLGAQQEPAQPTQLRFAFHRAAWEDVLNWLADSSDLALQVAELPTGSFTYSDQRGYSPDEAISRLNLFLIPRGYSLVRSGNLLAVISLNSEVSLRQLDSMAEAITPDHLAEKAEQALVKCLFPLDGIDPAVAVRELSALQLIREPIVLPNAGQIAVTDTAGKLRIVQQVLRRLGEGSSAGKPVTRFPFGAVDPETILAMVRPHVGLADGELDGPDVSLSIDRRGRQILASGSPENVAKVAAVIELLQGDASRPPDAAHLFRTHSVGSGDIDTVTSVLETLLADENMRMVSDANTNQLAVLGSEAVHQRVADTIQDLADSNAVEFKAIPVPSVDLRYAASVVYRMFAPGGDAETSSDASARTAPKIDIDWHHRRLFVRARRHQIDEIERVLRELAGPAPEKDARLRLLPYTGDRGRQILESARQFWPHDDELHVLPPLEPSARRAVEREIGAPATGEPPRTGQPRAEPARSPATPPAPREREDVTRLAVRNASAGEAGSYRQPARQPDDAGHRPTIRAQWTPRGILIHSADATALRRFEQHVEQIAGPAELAGLRLAVFYLKHASVDEASQLLRNVLGAEGQNAPFAFGLPAGAPAPERRGPNQGELLRAGIGPDALREQWTAGTATIIPDKRLNRVFVYATPRDLAEIEAHLEIIDRESGLAPIKTFGTPHVIRLRHVRASEVAGIIRDAYAGRIAATAQERREAARQVQRRAAGEREPGQRAAAAQLETETGEQPKMTLAVDTPGNALIVTAPEQLANEVKQLALAIDEQGAQAVGVIAVQGVPSSRVYQTLSSLFGDRVQSGSILPNDERGDKDARTGRRDETPRAGSQPRRAEPRAAPSPAPARRGAP